MNVYLRAAAALLLLATAQGTEVDESHSEMRPLMERFTADRGNLQRFYNLDGSNERHERLRKYYTDWLSGLPALKFDGMSQDGKIDYLFFRNGLDHELRVLEINTKEDIAAKPYVPFAPTILSLEMCRRQMEPLNPREAAGKLANLAHDIDETRKTIETQIKSANAAEAVRERKIHASRALVRAESLRNTLRTWFTFYNGYDPQFTWWAAEDYKKADASLQSYSAFLREHVLGLKPAAGAQAGDSGDIIGNPVGRDALMSDLAYEMIPYTPEQLIAIANKEFAWCENEMKRASREMGYGDDWKKALEKVKNLYVEPGKQPQMIRELALEAEKFMDDHDLVTIPPIAHETWRMEMMSPQRQLVNPFFTGGETISVSYPTDTMSYEQKLMSMRGNNIPFAKATVFHELIPGHELQGYMGARFHSYRGAVFGHSPFVTEGWSLYWEMLLWDMKFEKTPEERVGALFWRMHRCARIIFSLSFHLGKMTPDECINFLVDRVGFERENAIGEVRRSFAGSYGPLYQAAYLLGGMQFYAMHRELVDSHKMTNRQFHDAILKENWIPVELIRASLTHQPLTRDHKSNWKFYGDVAGQ
jgi:uncharacterized protein DUF885